MESKSNPKFSISNWSIKHIYRKLNLIYNIDFVVQHTKAEGEVNCNFICKLANCTFVLTNKQPFLKLPSTGMRWDEGWGEIPELGNKSHLSSLAFPNEYQLFSVWKHFLREFYHQKAIMLTNIYIPFISCLGNVTLLSK